MSFWTFVRTELWRRPERTVFTVVSLATGFLLFGLLQSVNAAFGAAVVRSHANRLMVNERFGAPMPLAYMSRIQSVAGVTQLTLMDFLPAFYRDSKQPIFVIAASPTRFFGIYDEYKTQPAGLEQLTRTRTGLIVLDKVAQRFGWKIGDRISLTSPVPTRDGNHGWTFDIVGITSVPSNPAQPPFAVMNYTYLDGMRGPPGGTVATYVVGVADPHRAASVARSIDGLFANSSAPTRTQAESAWASQAVSEIGDVKWLTNSVIVAVFFAMLFLTGNVVLESVRERTSELAVLKTLGYSDTRVLVLIELEALALCLSGAVIGLALAEATFHFVGRTLGKVNDWLTTTNELSGGIILAGVGGAIALTLVAAALPALTAKRLDIVDALRVRT